VFLPKKVSLKSTASLLPRIGNAHAGHFSKAVHPNFHVFKSTFFKLSIKSQDSLPPLSVQKRPTNKEDESIIFPLILTSSYMKQRQRKYKIQNDLMVSLINQ